MKKQSEASDWAGWISFQQTPTTKTVISTTDRNIHHNNTTTMMLVQISEVVRTGKQANQTGQTELVR